MTTPLAEQRVNTTTLNDQSAPSIVKLADGYVVAWQSVQVPDGYDNQRFAAGSDIYMQRYSDAGVAVGGEVRVNSVTFNDQVQPAVVALADGGFVIAWASAREHAVVNFDYGVYLQRYDAGGIAVGGETRVNDFYFLNQQRPSIAALSGAGFVVAWASDVQFPSAPGVYAKLFGADGVAVGGEIRIDTSNSGLQASPVAAGLADGGYVIAWDGNGDIHMQRFDAGGVAQAAAVRVNARAADYQSSPAVTVLADGGWLVAWESSGQDGSGSGIYMQRYGASGAAAGSETRVNTTTAGDQGAPTLTALPDGGFLVGWESLGQDGGGGGIYAQRHDAGGHAVGAETRINSTTAGDQSAVAMAASADGGFAAAWMSYQQDGSGWGVYSKVFANDAHVWQAAALLTAAFGNAPERSALSQWTAQADHSSGMAELGQKMIDFYAPGVSSPDLVAHLYRTLVGQAADGETVQALAGYIGEGGPFTTQGEFFAFAASLELNTQHMAGLIGSAQQIDAGWF